MHRTRFVRSAARRAVIHLEALQQKVAKQHHERVLKEVWEAVEARMNVSMRESVQDDAPSDITPSPHAAMRKG